MKAITIFVLSAIILAGCGQVDSTINSFKSSAGLLERKVTLYTADGTVLRTWVTDNQIEYAGPVAGFIAKDGTNVRISGTFVIEGK
jgi:hypothetical protein